MRLRIEHRGPGQVIDEISKINGASHDFKLADIELPTTYIYGSSV